ncbi:MAG: transposase [Azospirillum sp.]|nr:transposase [Azospirillum sp.]
MPVKRRITYKLYPSRSQAIALSEALRLHQRLYNAALEERIDAWRKARKSVSYVDQAASLTQIRKDDPAYRGLNCHSLQQTLRRLDRAFKAFFARVRKNAAGVGFPRFKALDRHRGWSYNAHGDGFKFAPGENGRNGKLYLQGIGTLKARGRPRNRPTRILCADVCCKNGKDWHLSLVVEALPDRIGGQAACGLDWGVSRFATLVTKPGVTENDMPPAFESIANPRHLLRRAKDLRRAQRALSRKRRGSNNRRKARQRVAKLHARARNARNDFHHQVTSSLVKRFALIATEDLQIKNMTASAKGTSAEPGKNVRQKAGLNRSILDTAPAAFLQKLSYKAEEAGSRLILYRPAETRASQTCPACGHVHKKSLSERTHACAVCGHVEDRDAAAARVLLQLALGVQPAARGREPAGEVDSAERPVTRAKRRRTSKPCLEQPARAA